MSGDEPNVIGCFACGDDPRDCAKCEGTGRVFWGYGRTFPYTEKGRLYARAALIREQRLAASEHK